MRAPAAVAAFGRPGRCRSASGVGAVDRSATSASNRASASSSRSTSNLLDTFCEAVGSVDH